METKHVVYRYPGVKPFEADEQALFFGRDRDIQDLCDLIRVEKLSVLFGKSGYGKSHSYNHTGGISLYRCVDITCTSRKIDYIVELPANLGFCHTENSPI